MGRNSFFIAAVCGLVMAAVSGPLRAASPPPTPSATQCLAVADLGNSNVADDCTISGVNLAPGECELYGRCKTNWYSRSEGWSESNVPPPRGTRQTCGFPEANDANTALRYTCATTSNRYSPSTNAEFRNCDGGMKVGSC